MFIAGGQGIDFSKGARVTFVDGLGGKFGTELKDVEKEILEVVERQKEGAEGKILVVLDGVDFLVAGLGIQVEEVMDMVQEIKQHAYATIITVSADSALMQSASTPLEVNHAALVMGFAHQARVILGVRSLETGTARDVSGVLRVVRGAGVEEEEEVEEKEVLYFVGGDGGVKVFERGG